jgi:hypothetical protein
MAFDNDFGARGHIKITRLALDDLDGFAVEGTQERSLIHLGRNGHPADYRHSGITALHDGERHWLTKLFPFRPDHPDVLLGQKQASHVAVVDRHDPRYRPVGPPHVGGSRDDNPPGIEVAAAIVLVHLRNRKPIERGVGAQQNVLLAVSRASRDPLRRNRFLSMYRHQMLD